MFGFLRRATSRPLPDSISRAIAADGLTPSGGSPAQLRMVETGGRYSDRKVTYFRIFDPAVVAQRALDVRRYRDLDGSPTLIVRAGHVEKDGKVVLTRPAPSPSAPVRTRAGRTVPMTGAGSVVSGEVSASPTARPVETPTAGEAR